MNTPTTDRQYPIELVGLRNKDGLGHDRSTGALRPAVRADSIAWSIWCCIMSESAFFRQASRSGASVFLWFAARAAWPPIQNLLFRHCSALLEPTIVALPDFNEVN